MADHQSGPLIKIRSHAGHPIVIPKTRNKHTGHLSGDQLFRHRGTKRNQRSGHLAQLFRIQNIFFLKCEIHETRFPHDPLKTGVAEGILRIQKSAVRLVENIDQKFFLQMFLKIAGNVGPAAFYRFKASLLFQCLNCPEGYHIAATELLAHLPDGRQFLAGGINSRFQALKQLFFHFSTQHF